jgi:hypothetical protein
MRTKTLLLTAALAAIGASTSMAQVYSVNVVGYVNKSVPKGFYMLANQLNASPNNKVATLIPNPPNGTFVFKFNPANGGYVTIDFADGAWEGDDVDMTLNPGEGVFIQSPSQHNITFVGEVQNVSDVPINKGFSIVSSVIPQSAPLDQLQFPASQGDFVFRYNPSNGGYIVDDFADGAWEGDSGGTAPTPDLSEAFFVQHPQSAAVTHWNRTFTP